MHNINPMKGPSNPIEGITEPADALLGSQLTQSRERSKSPMTAQDVADSSATTNDRSNDANEGGNHNTTKNEMTTTENEAREPEITQPVATPARKRAKPNKSTLTCTMGKGAKICGKPMPEDEIGNFARCPECRMKGRVASKKRNDKKRMRTAPSSIRDTSDDVSEHMNMKESEGSEGPITRNNTMITIVKGNGTTGILIQDRADSSINIGKVIQFRGRVEAQF